MSIVAIAAAAATRRRRRAWTPAALSGIAFWGSGDSVTVDGSSVLTAWPNKGGGAIVGTAGTAAPSLVADGINGKPSLRFTAASSQFVTLDDLAAQLTGSDVPYTLAISLQLAASDVSQWYWSLGSSAGTAPKDTRGAVSTGLWRHQRRDDSTTLVTVDGSATVDTSAHVLVDTFGGTTSSHYVDGVVDFEDSACDVGTLTLNQATIGARRAFAVDQYFGGDIRQIVVVPGRVVSAAERALLTAYLADDAGVTLA